MHQHSGTGASQTSLEIMLINKCICDNVFQHRLAAVEAAQEHQLSTQLQCQSHHSHAQPGAQFWTSIRASISCDRCACWLLLIRTCLVLLQASMRQ